MHSMLHRNASSIVQRRKETAALLSKLSVTWCAPLKGEDPQISAAISSDRRDSPTLLDLVQEPFDQVPRAIRPSRNCRTARSGGTSSRRRNQTGGDAR